MNVPDELTEEIIDEWLESLDKSYGEKMINEVMSEIMDMNNHTYFDFKKLINNKIDKYCNKYHYCTLCFEKMVSRNFIETHTEVDSFQGEKLHEWYCINCD